MSTPSLPLSLPNRSSQGFDEAVQDFIAKVQKRAVDKRREMEEARRRGEDVDGFVEEELAEEERLGPGGLDPVEVFEALPRELQEAFESRDMGKLHAALAAMPVEEAKRHMKACADSGAFLGWWCVCVSRGGGGFSIIIKS
jgi:cell division cycle protein 37